MLAYMERVGGVMIDRYARVVWNHSRDYCMRSLRHDILWLGQSQLSTSIISCKMKSSAIHGSTTPHSFSHITLSVTSLFHWFIQMQQRHKQVKEKIVKIETENFERNSENRNKKRGYK